MRSTSCSSIPEMPDISTSVTTHRISAGAAARNSSADAKLSTEKPSDRSRLSSARRIDGESSIMAMGLIDCNVNSTRRLSDPSDEPFQPAI